MNNIIVLRIMKSGYDSFQTQSSNVLLQLIIFNGLDVQSTNDHRCAVDRID
jgi:hypothetical protein